MSPGDWTVVLRAAELAPGEVAWVQLRGEEIALWRAADGGLNAWANRCPHRGVRLTLGDVVGDELRCRYHGWRFASGNAACTAIPAHPERTPAAALHAQAYPCREAYGFVWVSLSDGRGSPHLGLTEGDVTTARSVVIHAAASEVAAALGERDDVVVALQPVSESSTVVHAAFPRTLAGPARSAALREHDRRMRTLRDRLERPVLA